MPRICIIPKATNTGGVTSFQAKLAAGLSAHGLQACYSLEDKPYDAVLLTSTTRNMAGLLGARRRGLRIVQRLDGINWLHRRLPTGPRHFLRAEYGNRLLALLRARVVTQVVYQSEFVRGWWDRQFGAERVPSTVIHNGVDLSVYTPEGPEERPSDCTRLLLVEGSLQGGYESGLQTALALAEGLAEDHPLELTVAGRVSVEVQEAARAKSRVPIRFAGLVPREQIPALDRSAHLLFSADLNAACPNSVIEALACGLPVAAFATGALPELVTGDAGQLAPYGGDPWKLEAPDLPALVAAAARIVRDQPRFRHAARARAEEAFGLDRMVENYLEILLG
ncbi:MAG TPA: glycosyltransferase family 4 protein [Anaerolineales bacterium]|nr:glycosyltransferase family 4 protein [Anaerolineales bacterium]